MQRNVSIIISNFQSIECLQKVFWGYFTQTYRNFELVLIVLADKQAEVSQWIETVQKQAFFPIRVLVSDVELPMMDIAAFVETDFIVFSEADCIPRQDFIAQHLQYREEGFWLQGTADEISQTTFNYIHQQSVYTGVAFENKWIKKQGGKLSVFNGPLYQWGWKAAFLATFSFSKPKLNLKNVSFWKSDLRSLEVKTQFELQTYLSIQKLEVKKIAYRTTVLTLNKST